jgi:hypothetical protein
MKNRKKTNDTYFKISIYSLQREGGGKNSSRSNMQYIKHRKPDGQENKLPLSRFMLQTIEELVGFVKMNKIFWKLNILHSCFISWNVYEKYM